MVERWHRTFKAAIMCHNAPNWLDVLPTVLLGLRTHVRLDTKASPAEFLYGTVLRIPGEFFLQEDFTPDPQIFVDDFRQHMRQVKPVPVAHHYKRRAFRFKELSACTHVFLRKDCVKKPLERPYIPVPTECSSVPPTKFILSRSTADPCLFPSSVSNPRISSRTTFRFPTFRPRPTKRPSRPHRQAFRKARLKPTRDQKNASE
ncbi:PREDICTED: uncharacterized protein LOC105565658 [Vollenhovia emeryi]|uniref:uncharacterized protein LOC105565658 n=1 Tax=Vollenhovia emeryi TaxID=411798 RepID=UPI0005F4270E|nr:PREDICTED: uncharacterized protein LOC105565658 [Vollenhovia emeryi]